MVRFNVATGLTSIVGNLVLMAILVEALGLPPLVGNAIAVGLLSVVNFIVSDRGVFSARRTSASASDRWVLQVSAVACPSACALRRGCDRRPSQATLRRMEGVRRPRRKPGSNGRRAIVGA